MLWSGGFVQQMGQETEAQKARTMRCTNELQFYIKSIDFEEGDSQCYFGKFRDSGSGII